MSSGRMIRDARERLGESQAVFAKRFGVDQSTIHRWEVEGPPPRGPARLLLDQFFAAGSVGRAKLPKSSQRVAG